MNKKEMLLRQQGIIDLAKSEGRDLTLSEKTEFDGLTESIKSIPKDPNKSDGIIEAIENERMRNLALTDLCAQFKDLDFVASDIISDRTMTVDKFKSMIVEKQIKNNGPANVGAVADEGDKFRNAVSDGLLLKSGLSITGEDSKNRIENANNFRNMSLERLAIECLERDGVKTKSMDKDGLFSALMQRQFYNPSASFPSIMDQVIQKSYVEGYEQAPATYDAWVKEGSLTDFKKTNGNYVAGAAGELLEIPESGELKMDNPGDHKKAERQLKTYGRQFAMSRQAFINDDIGYITTIPARYARSSRMTINKQVYSLMYANGLIFDGKALFCKEHKNMLTVGTKPTLESYKAIRQMIRKQLGYDEEALNLTMSHIITPSDWETDFAEILMSQRISDETVTNKYNPFYGDNVKVIVDDTIATIAGVNACPWFAVSQNAPSIQVDYLNGQKIPTIRRSEPTGTLGLVWDIFHDWGISAVDFRGLVKNPGIKL